MIFRDLILELKDEVGAAVLELFTAAAENQTHPQDLLLVDQHGFYNERLAHPKIRAELGTSPYVIGPDEIGFSEATFYEFMDWYRQSHVFDRDDFKKQVETDEEAAMQEKLTIQLEQSIYLRFWEADSLLKQYHQLSSLATGQTYDWHLQIPNNPRQGSKHELIRKQIRDRVRLTCPRFYALVRDNYKSQVRNAIAHSQFYVIGSTIRFLNHSLDPAARSPIGGYSFDEWYRVFHTTLLLHNETIGAFKRARHYYRDKTLKAGNRIEVRITDADGTESFSELGVLHDRDDWIWRANLREEDLRQQAG